MSGSTNNRNSGGIFGALSSAASAVSNAVTGNKTSAIGAVRTPNEIMANLQRKVEENAAKAANKAAKNAAKAANKDAKNAAKAAAEAAKNAAANAVYKEGKWPAEPAPPVTNPFMPPSTTSGGMAPVNFSYGPRMQQPSERVMQWATTAGVPTPTGPEMRNVAHGGKRRTHKRRTHRVKHRKSHKKHTRKHRTVKRKTQRNKRRN